jgi:transposase
VSNVLKVSIQETIHLLAARGWSQRRIGRELAINRETVARHLALGLKPAISTAGVALASEAKPAISTAGPDEPDEVNPAISTTGKGAGRKSQCEPLLGTIAAKLEEGLSAQRIFQDLVTQSGFTDSYESVKRFVRKLRQSSPKRVWRMECQPGEEAQVDFGLGAPVEIGAGKTRRAWVLRVVLSYSRKGYSEVVARQDTESFLRCLENAIRSFGGAPLILNLDNLKAAVLRADWFDPEINPKMRDFCRHYGTNAVPCRPRTPQHKGKVERGVGYVYNNGLKGMRFKSIADQNLHLARWEEQVADRRIHGTTRKQVAALFEEERPHLLPLPDSLFPAYQEARRSVHRDSYVEVEKAYYEAPAEFIGRQVWVRWDGHSVRIYNDQMEQVQMHVRQPAGKFSRSLGAGGWKAPVRASCRYWADRASVIGEQCGNWAQSAIDARGPEALRSVMALCKLIEKHSSLALNTACAKALASGTHRIKDVRKLIGEPLEQGSFNFEQKHPLIRDLNAYSEFIEHHFAATE